MGVTMWSVLTVVTILTYHLSLGQDELSGDTLDSFGQDEASEGIQLLEPRYSCPEYNVGFWSHDIDIVHGIPNWHTCGEICSLTPACKFWTWTVYPEVCWMKNSDQGLTHAEGRISGVKGCK